MLESCGERDVVGVLERPSFSHSRVVQSFDASGARRRGVSARVLAPPLGRNTNIKSMKTFLKAITRNELDPICFNTWYPLRNRQFQNETHCQWQRVKTVHQTPKKCLPIRMVHALDKIIEVDTRKIECLS